MNYVAIQLHELLCQFSSKTFEFNIYSWVIKGALKSGHLVAALALQLPAMSL